jgi:hypothetical protein
MFSDRTFSPSSNNCFFKHSSFINIHNSNSNGGAISLTSTNKINFIVFDALFSQCSADGYDCGAIDFSTKGEIFMNFVCGYECQANSYHFSRCFTENTDNLNNLSHRFLSIHHCGLQDKNDVLRFTYGHHQGFSSNISNNQCGTYIHYFSNGYSGISSILYCLFSSNIASNLENFQFRGINLANSQYHISFCNFINNSSLNSYLFFSYASINYYTNCIFNINKCKYLFYLETGSITLTESYIFSSYSSSLNTKNSIIMTDSRSEFQNQFSFFNTAHCNNEQSTIIFFLNHFYNPSEISCKLISSLFNAFFIIFFLS